MEKNNFVYEAFKKDAAERMKKSGGVLGRDGVFRATDTAEIYDLQPLVSLKGMVYAVGFLRNESAGIRTIRFIRVPPAEVACPCSFRQCITPKGVLLRGSFFLLFICRPYRAFM